MTSLQRAIQKPSKPQEYILTAAKGSFELSFVGGLDFSEISVTTSGPTNIISASAQHLQRKELAKREEEDHAREEQELMSKVVASLNEENVDDDDMGRISLKTRSSISKSGKSAMDFLGNTLAQMHGEDRNGGNCERRRKADSKKKKGDGRVEVVNKRSAVKKTSLAKKFISRKQRR